MIFIKDRQFETIGILDNQTEKTIHFTDFVFRENIEDGIDTLDFTTTNESDMVEALEVGNLIEFPYSDRVSFLTIRSVHTSTWERQVHAESIGLDLLYSQTQPIELPETEQTIDYYLRSAITGTGWVLGHVEAFRSKKLEFSGNDNSLARVRAIADEFEAKLKFVTTYNEDGEPRMVLEAYSKLGIEQEDVIFTTDTNVNGVEREVSIDDMCTSVTVRGKKIEEVDKEVAIDKGVLSPKKQEEIILNDKTEIMIDEAMAQKGKRYVWGAVGPNTFDCSGLIIHAGKKAGFLINGRPTTYTFWKDKSGQYKRITGVSARRGDLVLIDTIGEPPGHVGIYLGNGRMIHAGDPVQEDIVSRYKVMGYVRIMW